MLCVERATKLVVKLLLLLFVFVVGQILMISLAIYLNSKRKSWLDSGHIVADECSLADYLTNIEQNQYF